MNNRSWCYPFVGFLTNKLITFGVGEVFQGWVAVNASQEALKVVAKAATHATVQGTIATMDGGDFGSSFLSGFAGGLMSTAGDALKWGSVGTVSSAMLMGGVSSELSGGEFWRGAAVGGIVAGANHVAHRVGASAEEKVQQKRVQRQDVTDKFYQQLARTELFFSTAKEMFDQITNPVNRFEEKLRFFAEMTKTGALFDIKQEGMGFSRLEIGKKAIFEGEVYRYDDFGNINFGYAARVFGIPLEVGLGGAGLNQIFSEVGPDLRNVRGYFDQRRDTQMIIHGYKYIPIWGK